MTIEQAIPLQIMMLIILASLFFFVKTQSLLAAKRAGKWGAPSEPAPQPEQSAPVPAAIEPLPGAGLALGNPSGLLQTTLDAIRSADQTNTTAQPYTIPLGWEITAHRKPTGELIPDVKLHRASLVEDVYNILITAKTRKGKDNAALNMLLSLAAHYTPRQVQFCLMDGKGLDWAAWGNKAHTWRLAMRDTEIGPTMQALTKERARRLEILTKAGAKKWESYTGGDMPLLVVYVSELLQLQIATSPKELAAWLSSELSSAAAFGFRYIISTHNAANFDTQWRGQIDLFLAGYQPAQSADMPNTGLSTNELKTLGGVPPSELPAAAGVFTIVKGRDVSTIRTSFINDQETTRWLAKMPNNLLHSSVPQRLEQSATATNYSDQSMLLELLQTGQPLPITDEQAASASPTFSSAASGHSNGQNSGALHASPALHSTEFFERERHPSATSEALAVDVPEIEEQRIIAAAKKATSRREVCQALYNTTGGKQYKWVKQVCDTRGLLTTSGA